MGEMDGRDGLKRWVEEVEVENKGYLQITALNDRFVLVLLQACAVSTTACAVSRTARAVLETAVRFRQTVCAGWSSGLCWLAIRFVLFRQTSRAVK